MTPNESAQGHLPDRTSEWFVPAFGSPKFRYIVGMLFLPYTGMVISFTVTGAMLAEKVYWDRVLATVVVYFLGLGITAHALDAAGSKEAKPWGTLFTKAQLWFVAIVSLIIAYLIAVYYMVLYVPLISIVAVIEGFFVFAYNLEWFGGRLHTDAWFAFSWGFLPVCAGYMMQTNRISLEALILGGSMALFSQVEIKASRPYKSLRRRETKLSMEERDMLKRYEAVLKSISIGVLLLGAGLLLRRALG